MSEIRVVAVAASLRNGSWNKKLIRFAARAAEEAGATVTLLDLKEHPLPVYDGDIEAEGMPDSVTKLKELLIPQHAWLVATPEYNGGIPGGFKNMIDWVSRPMPGEPALAAFKGKPAGVMAASPGAMGGARVLPQLRNQLANIGMMVVPGMYGLGNADKAFDADGNLTDEKAAGMVSKLAQTLVDITRRVAS